MEEPRWYVVHTYSGYENKVQANIKKIVKNQSMEQEILEVVVPMQDTVEFKNGMRKTVSRKVLPGYVLIKMVMNDDTWYVVRNTRGVTSFVGPGSKPVPLSEEEVAAMSIEDIKEVVDFEIGDSVKIMDGLFEDTIGSVKQINENTRRVIVMLSVLGRETPVELDFAQIVKLV
jgi:transcriptional antiterminator NusG